MKNFYITVAQKGDQYRENGVFDREPKEGYYAFVIKISENDNALAMLNHFSCLVHANIRPTKKDAQQLADFWNECYKKNGTYLYSK